VKDDGTYSRNWRLVGRICTELLVRQGVSLPQCMALENGRPKSIQGDRDEHTIYIFSQLLKEIEKENN